MEAIDTGRSEWRVENVRADDACEFGKWLSALPLSQRLSDSFKKVRSLHTEFHGLASTVLELALSGRALSPGVYFVRVAQAVRKVVDLWAAQLRALHRVLLRPPGAVPSAPSR